MRILILSNLITMLNILAGYFSIIFSINHNYAIAAALLLIAVIFDFLDGKIASFLKKENEFGKNLDSLSDVISFGAAPVVFGLALINNLFAVTAFSIFLICGIIRLAKFNTLKFRGYYYGMPITINGIIIPFIYFLKLPPEYYPYTYLILAVAMISNFRIKKL